MIISFELHVSAFILSLVLMGQSGTILNLPQCDVHCLVYLVSMSCFICKAFIAVICSQGTGRTLSEGNFANKDHRPDIEVCMNLILYWSVPLCIFSCIIISLTHEWWLIKSHYSWKLRASKLLLGTYERKTSIDSLKHYSFALPACEETSETSLGFYEKSKGPLKKPVSKAN